MSHSNFDACFLMPPPAYRPRILPGPMFRVPHSPGFRGWRGGRGFPPHPLTHQSSFRNRHQLKKQLKAKKREERARAKQTASSKKAASIIFKRAWSLKDAQRALTFEKEYNASKGSVTIRLEFPDLHLDQDNVRCLHPNINCVFLKKPITRSCFVQLRPDADVDRVLADLNGKSLPEFNNRCLHASLVRQTLEEVLPEDIDPLSLYIGNIPLHVTPIYLQQLFPNRTRMDVGHAAKLKYTRYVLVRFSNLKESIDAFKRAINLTFDKRRLIVRFKRFKVKKDRESDSVTAATCGDEAEFHYIPDTRSQQSSSSTVSADTDSSEDSAEVEYDPEEYDMEELHPPPRPPSLALLRFLRSNDENETHFPDYDPKRNITVLPEDVFSVTTTDSLLDLDSPYK